MKKMQSLVAGLVLFGLISLAIPSRALAIAISSGSDTTAGLGNTANAVVRIAAGGFVGTGTVLQILPYNGGVDIDVLTADHVVRDNFGQSYAANQVTVSFGNQGGGGASFVPNALASDFTVPQDGSSQVDLAMLDIFVPANQLNTLPAGLAAVALPGAAPAANAAITQAGYGLQASVVTVSGNLAYSYAPNFMDGAAYGTLKAGPNTVNANGVTNITGALSTYAGGVDMNGNPVATNFHYVFSGFQNGALINGNAGNNYAGSTSYIFSGDSGGPSLSGNTILGVHSSSVTGSITGGGNGNQFAYATTTDANYLWQDVSVFDNLAWINDELANLSPVPEPSTWALLAIAGVLCSLKRRRK
jgi:hypothetical protein